MIIESDTRNKSSESILMIDENNILFCILRKDNNVQNTRCQMTTTKA